MSFTERLYYLLSEWLRGTLPPVEPLIYTRCKRNQVMTHDHPCFGEPVMANCAVVYDVRTYVVTIDGVPTEMRPPRNTTVRAWKELLGATEVRMKGDFRAVRV